MESWLSGRKRFTANEVRFKRLQGFESLTLRKYQNPNKAKALFGFCCILRESKGFEELLRSD
jgi:hypothetical protein